MIRARRSAGNKASSTSSRLDWVMSMIKPSGYYPHPREVCVKRDVALLIPIPLAESARFILALLITEQVIVIDGTTLVHFTDDLSRRTGKKREIHARNTNF